MDTDISWGEGEGMGSILGWVMEVVTLDIALKTNVSLFTQEYEWIQTLVGR